MKTKTTTSQGRGSAEGFAAEEAARLGRAMDYMRKHFATARLADVAPAAGLSVFHFHRRFTQWAGRTPKAVLTGMQIEHAQALMLEGGLDLAEVARRCGFSHQSHLTTRFREFVGQTPARWLRARQIEALDPVYEDARAEAA